MAAFLAGRHCLNRVYIYGFQKPSHIVMSLSRPEFKFPHRHPEKVLAPGILKTRYLALQILKSINQNTDHFLDIGPWMAALVPWIPRPFPLHETDRLSSVTGNGIKIVNYIDVPRVNHFHSRSLPYSVSITPRMDSSQS